MFLIFLMIVGLRVILIVKTKKVHPFSDNRESDSCDDDNNDLKFGGGETCGSKQYNFPTL